VALRFQFAGLAGAADQNVESFLKGRTSGLGARVMLHGPELPIPGGSCAELDLESGGESSTCSWEQGFSSGATSGPTSGGCVGRAPIIDRAAPGGSALTSRS